MSAHLLRHFRMLAQYNRVANERIYSACFRLAPEALETQQGASFGSILGTLNHLLVGDTIWITRFEGGRHRSTALDRRLHSELTPLWAARQAMDARIERVMAGFTTADLRRHISYLNNQGLPYTDPLPLALAHFFNHQTHHRGQLHVLLRQVAPEALALDLHPLLNPEPDVIP